MGFLPQLMQILGAVISVGIAVCGISHVNNSASLRVQWEDSGHSNSWTHNNNSEIGLFFFGVCIFALGLVSFVAILRIKGWAISLHPWKVLGPAYMIIGALTLGASGNMGIVCGSAALFFGLILLIIALVSSTDQGSLKVGSMNSPQLLVVLLTFLCAIGFAGVFVAGVICLSDLGGSHVLEWVDSDSAWTHITNRNYALGAYAFALMIFSIVGIIANFQVKGWFSSLYNWSSLSFYEIFVGVLGMGAAGNTGVLFGAFLCGVGAMKLLVWIFAGDRKGSYQQL